ncbi:hypothetical protein GGX14DRAFT_633705 [Mycena pura]|uniref:Uncharacterized protein n=1 Tax=Mycena pura TaxID=153505 RepID=A0AAD6Y936_9AGAR|nr:hypothetical protein GGX14DRAFT_633705 [Mycena pura]
MSDYYVQGRFYLPPRNECLLCDCGGSTFIVDSDLRASPPAPDTLCTFKTTHETPTTIAGGVPIAVSTVAAFLAHPLDGCPTPCVISVIGNGSYIKGRQVNPLAESMPSVGPTIQSTSSQSYVNSFTFSDDPSPAPGPLPSLPSPLTAFIPNSRFPAISRFQEQGPHQGTVREQRMASIGRMNAAAGPHSSRRKATTASAGNGFGASSSANGAAVELDSPAPPGIIKYLFCILPYQQLQQIKFNLARSFYPLKI